MAAILVSQLLAFQTRGAFYLCGYSFAGTLAFEIARQLETVGRRVAFLALLDTKCRVDLAQQEQGGTPLTRRQRQRNHRYIWRHLSARDRVTYFSYYAQQRVNAIRERLMHPRKTDKRNLLKKEVTRRFVERGRRNRIASASYCMQSYAGSVTLFRAMLEYRGERSLDLGWNMIAKGGVDVVEVSGNHIEILKLPHVRMLARRFRRCLREAQQKEPLDAGNSYQDNPFSDGNSCARNLIATDDAK
jgi:thioesterase domain-containing protein